MIGPLPYTALQQMLDAGNAFGHQVYVKSNHLNALSDEVIDLLVAHAAGVTSPQSAIIVLPLGGAVGRVGENDTAFGREMTADDVKYTFLVPNEANRTQVRQAVEAIFAKQEGLGPENVRAFAGSSGQTCGSADRTACPGDSLA